MTINSLLFPPVDECPLRFQALRRPTGIAITGDDKSISFLQLDQMVEHCRVGLVEKGIKAGERLLFVTNDPLKTVVTLFACLRSQWVFSPVNPVFPEDQRNAYADRIGAAFIEKGEGLWLLFGDENRFNTELSPINVSESATFDLIATSGTTGIPKAVAHSYHNHYYSAVGSMNTLPLTVDDTWLLSLPLFHVGGLAIVMRCMLAGAAMAIFQNKKPISEMLNEKTISHLSLVNTQLFRLLEAGVNLHATGVKFILLGGGVASPRLVDKVRAQGVNLLTTYGMTEMASQVCTGEPMFIDGNVSSGCVLPHRQLMLSEGDEILVRGEVLAKGCFENGGIETFVDRSGWFHTGDKGEWIGDQIKINGRIDNMMISGGENIHPEEIEQVLLTLPGIVQAVIVAMEHPEFGQRPVAYVQTTDGKINESAIKGGLKGKLPKFKIPEHIRLFPAYISESGVKVNRKLFQNLA